jgi:hypothetical protein
MATEGPLHFRGIGGTYKITAQATNENEYALIVNWLYAAIAAAVGHSRVYQDWPETQSIAAGTEFITYVFDHADPDKYTHGAGNSRTRVTIMYFEILVWKQGQNYASIDSTAATLTGALDVAMTDRGADGVITGAERYQFKLARWSTQ